jgi:hypothetical protein
MTIGKIETVQPAGKSRLAITFDDGLHATVDLGRVIQKHAALAPLADPAIFDRVQLSDDGWSVEWPERGVDFGAQQLRRWADEQSGRTMPADKFREWMRRNKLTLDAAADALGLSRRTIAYYLSGEQPIPRTVMLATEGFEARKVA